MTKFEVLFAQLQTEYILNGTVNPMKVTSIKAVIASNPNQLIINEPFDDLNINDVFGFWLGSVLSEESWKREMQDAVVTKEDIEAIEREMKLSRIPMFGKVLIDLTRP